ncbi:MAG TPA: N-6 DNA methylase, partial [Ktedonobacteraceae bacterium]|nr:N-6 DNA methylase [Ktedonobacteraceae bacterium]
RKSPGALSQLSLFESEPAEALAAPVSLEEVQPVSMSEEPLLEPLPQEQGDFAESLQPEQEGCQVSVPHPDLAVFSEPGMLAWPFAFPPEPPARAIERCVDRLSQSSIGGSRDTGFWQLVYLLCAKQAEEHHAAWPKRFFTNQKEAKKEQGAQAIAERILPLFEAVKAAYPGLFAEDETLQLSASTLAPLVLALCGQDLMMSELDPFGAAYQQWASARAREWRAQFFTPLGVAYFVTSLLQPQTQERVLDATCGAGVFFRALYTYRRYYLAGMAALIEEAGHPITGEELQHELASYMQSRVYGADLDGTLIRLARLQLAFLDGDPGHVYHMDSLAFPNENSDQEAKAQIPLGSFDLVVGNPPYSLPVTDPEILNRYELARVWKRQGESGFQRTDQLQRSVPTEVLFMEQALNWLKPGGRVALVVPESLLGNPGVAYARYWIMRHAYVVASISLPGETFQAQSHTGVHTGVLVLRKMTEAELEGEEKVSHNYSIFMAEVERVGYDSRGRTVYARTPDGELLQRAGERQVDNDLPAVLASFWRFQTSGEVNPPPPALEVPAEQTEDDSNASFLQQEGSLVERNC